MVVMKLVSPAQRGMACRWRWPATPAPAALPTFRPKLKPCGRVDALQSPLGALGQIDQLVRGFGGQRGQPVEMRVGHDHDVA